MFRNPSCIFLHNRRKCIVLAYIWLLNPYSQFYFTSSQSNSLSLFGINKTLLFMSQSCITRNRWLLSYDTCFRRKVRHKDDRAQYIYRVMKKVVCPLQKHLINKVRKEEGSIHQIKLVIYYILKMIRTIFLQSSTYDLRSKHINCNFMINFNGRSLNCHRGKGEMENGKKTKQMKNVSMGDSSIF